MLNVNDQSMRRKFLINVKVCNLPDGFVHLQ
jgi:hypothetical protein